MYVPAHINKLSKEPTSPNILTLLTGKKGAGESPQSKTGERPMPTTSRAGESSSSGGVGASLASRLGEGSPVPPRGQSLGVDSASLTSKMEEYAGLKQQLSMFLPHHLLNQSKLPQQLATHTTKQLIMITATNSLIHKLHTQATHTHTHTHGKKCPPLKV